MLKLMFTLLILASAGLAQSSSDGSFSVHHSKHANFSLSPAQMREAESLYQNACAAVQHEFHGGNGELHPHFTVILGKEANQVRTSPMKSDTDEIWMTKWDPAVFAEGVVVLAFDKLLTDVMVTQLSKRAILYSNATLDVAGFK